MNDRIDHVVSPGASKEMVSHLDDNGLVEAIRRRAHEIWEREGRPEGGDLEHWTEAEQEIIGQAPPLA